MRLLFFVTIFSLLYLGNLKLGVAQELFFPTTFFSLVFLYVTKNQKYSFSNIIYFFASIYLILYISVNGMLYLPESNVDHQKLYIKFTYYISLFSYFYLFYKKRSNLSLFFFTIVSISHIFLTWHYLSNPMKYIPIIFYMLIFFRQITGKKQVYIRINNIKLFTYLFIISGLVSTFFSISISNCLPILTYLLAGAMIVEITSHANSQEKKQLLSYLIYFFSISLAIITTFILLNQKLNVFQPTFLTNIGSFQVNSIGSMIALNLPIVIYFYLRGLKPKILYIVIIFASLVILYFTHSRASILASGICLSFILIHFFRKRFVQNKYNFILILILFSIFGFFIFWNTQKSYIFTDFNTVKIRFSIWKYFFYITSQNAPIFGFGPDNESLLAFFPARSVPSYNLKDITQYIEWTKSTPHAHNIIVQIFNNYGIFGISVYFSLVVYLAVWLFNSFRRKPVSLYLIIPLVCLFSIFIQELFDYTMPDPMIFSSVMLFLGFIASSESNSLLTIQSKLQLKSIRIAGVVLSCFLLILSYNYSNRNYILTIFKKRLAVDAFLNYSFLIPLETYPKKIKKFLKIDSLYLPLPMDMRREMVTGEIYLYLYQSKLYSKKKYLRIARQRYINCIQINPHSANCYYKLSHIYKITGNAKLSKKYMQEYQSRDQFNLVRQ